MTGGTWIEGAHVVLPTEVRQCHVLVKDTRISAIVDVIPDRDDNERVQAHGKFLLPGFVDIHTHGASGFDATFGSFDLKKQSFEGSEQAYREGLQECLRFMLSNGVTSMLPTFMAAPLEDTTEALRITHSAMVDCEFRQMIKGVNLEGTFIKSPEHAGAQNAEHFQVPSPGLISQLRSDFQNIIKIINLPPEHGGSIFDTIEKLVDEGLVIAGGHTAATADEYHKAVKAGLNLAVHFFNGPSASSYKVFGGGGAMQAMISNENVHLELILDGYHVSPIYVRDVLARKGHEKIIGISDSMFVTALATDDFKIAGLRGARHSSGAYLHKHGNPKVLFGSVLTMVQAFENLLNWLTTEMSGYWSAHHPAIEFADALTMTTQMCSTNAAQLLAAPTKKLPDYGAISIGMNADLVLATVDGVAGNYEVSCRSVFSEGKMYQHHDLV